MIAGQNSSNGADEARHNIRYFKTRQNKASIEMQGGYLFVHLLLVIFPSFIFSPFQKIFEECYLHKHIYVQNMKCYICL
jgi:hypothetical protein